MARVAIMDRIAIDDPENSLLTWFRRLYEDCLLHDRSVTQLMSVIVNFDECVIKYNSIPPRTYVGRHHEIRDLTSQSNRARITGLFGATASGRKFKALIVGKQANPRAFRGLDLANLPVHYFHSANACLTAKLFKEWFIGCFIHEIDDLRNGHIRIQFVLDNTPAHPIELQHVDPDITFKYLPPNTTSAIQPMDQGPLCSLKVRAKKSFYQKMLDFCQKHPEEPYVFDEFVRRYNILEGIRDIAAAWEAVPESTIVKSFAKIVPKDELERLVGGINDFEGFNNFEGLDEDLKSHIQESVTLLNGCHPSVTFTKKDIIQDVFLNPGQADEYTENIIDDVLQSED